MRAFAFVLLSLAAVYADSDADAYTIGQVATGHTYGGVVTGVDYGNGLVQGVGAIGNRAYAGHVGYAAPAGYAAVGHVGYAASPVAYGYSGLNHYGYGKREAEAAPDADAYTIGQVYNGLPIANAYASGRAHNVGVVTGTTYAAPAYTGYAGVGYAGVRNLGYAASPVTYGYSGLRHYGYGKREAEADSDAYTIGQVAYGLPVANAIATGHAHNVGVVTGTTYAAPAYTGYAGRVGYAGVGQVRYAASPVAYGYSGLNHYGYGKREAEADSDAYTIGQVAYGLPVANAIATGHAHNVGVVTGTTYAAPAYAGYTGYTGHHAYAGLGYSGLGYTGAYLG